MSVQIKWILDNDEAIISVYRSETEIDKENLPEPLATNITNKQYLDPENGTFYYLLKSEFQDEIFFSKQILSKIDVVGEFIFDLNEHYTPPSGTSINFLGMS